MVIETELFIYAFCFGRRRQLPSIEEAWNLPISAEMSSRAPKTAPPPYPGKRPEDPPPLTQHQLQTLQHLQRNSHNLSPQQQVNCCYDMLLYMCKDIWSLSKDRQMCRFKI